MSADWVDGDMRDPYTVLGLTKGAGAADVKKAFRRLAKQYHPDQSTDAKAKDKFAEVSAAYEILGDEKKRTAFDRGEIDAEGKPKFHGFEGFGAGSSGAGAAGRGGFSDFAGGRGGRGGGFDAADIFADLFGGASAGSRPRAGGFGQQATPVKGDDAQATVTVSLADSVHGASVRVSLPTGRDLDVSVPAGLEDGRQIRLKGQGYAGERGGAAGDAIVTVHIGRHAFFRADGADLRLDLPITLYEAVLGAKVNVPTLEGQVELGIPAGSNGSRTLRLRGKGLATSRTTRGDLLVALRVVLPDNADPALQALARQMADEAPYDPRKTLG